ncbi:hypothetical protein QN277_019699 [Acacia crassicarpa]|uniref:Endonuclease/exonuclease/phosphatase domain-containing protein n=1 Tax=Acacia crassicarpa TaxID=499986 RepID=A0AAE1KDR5_9FABA|nr:hypothetical protein QN277_019699 [Acacia crassicarpa]
MNYMIWNSRGTGAPSFPALIRDLKKHYQLNFMAILKTRCTHQLARTRAQLMGFPNMEIVDCEGYSGGIWCLWDDNIGAVTLVERNFQFLHFLITSSTGSSWHLTVIYASPNCNTRQVLWENLSRIALSIQGAWLIGGDLNVTLLHCERCSNASSSTSPDRDLLRWVEMQDMIDIGFVGPEFTWQRGNSEARLDRMLANEEWVAMFPNALVTHMPFFKSDHRSLLVRLSSKRDMSKPNRPFRFIAAWVLHDNFDDFVHQSWNQDVPWIQNISHFADACFLWNKEVFKHTDARKKRLLRRLDGINRVVAQIGMIPKYADLQLSL